MRAKRGDLFDVRELELGGVEYVVLPKPAFERLCKLAGVDTGPTEREPLLEAGLDRVSLAEKLVGRRKAAGLSQAELARRAGVRPETLNRIERGRTTPDFATIRKLVVAMNEAEQEKAEAKWPAPPDKEPKNASTS